MNNECWGPVGDAGLSLESLIQRMRTTELWEVNFGYTWRPLSPPPPLPSYIYFFFQVALFFEIIMEIKGEV